jgi:hypothetical protein
MLQAATVPVASNFTGLFAQNPAVQTAGQALVQAIDAAAASMIDAAEQGARLLISEAIVRKGAAAVAPRPPTASSVGSGTAAQIALAGITAAVNNLKGNASHTGALSRAHVRS